MADVCDPTPIASTEQYRAALLAVRERMTDVHLKMLQAHCKSPEHVITAAQLATAVGLDTPASAGLKYGTFARWLSEVLNFQPDIRGGGSFRWWMTVASGRPGSTSTVNSEFEWVMRPELVVALRAMRWVREVPAVSAT